MEFIIFEVNENFCVGNISRRCRGINERIIIFDNKLVEIIGI